jgi:hypothetical protein
VKPFAPYVHHLESLVREALHDSSGDVLTSHSIDEALDGQPSSELRRLVPLEDLRRAGAFFTGSRLAGRVASILKDSLRPDSVILDPACGAGDLLLACLPHFPNKPTLSAHAWATQILGRELHPQFVEAARKRLLLAAMRLGFQLDYRVGASATDALSGIRVGCGLSDQEAFTAATHVVLNPPFTRVEAPPGCTWARGGVNNSSTFVEACLLKTRPGTRIVAILPDVLRSGSRYAKWRYMVLSHAKLNSITMIGQFDRDTDVDVFLLDLVVAPAPSCQARSDFNPSGPRPTSVLCDVFDLCVGPVVDYRDVHLGKWHPFIRAQHLPRWEAVTRFKHSRRFQGRVIPPPFVVVRRTSRPGDRHRATATLILGSRPVAVENHLLVLVPKDGSVSQCRLAVDALRHPTVDAWLDRRIRCRHLTLSALSALPWRPTSK